MGSSTVQLQYVCKIKFTYHLKYKWYTSFRKCEYVYKTKFTYTIRSTLKHMLTKNMEICDLKSYSHDLINILFNNEILLFLVILSP